MRYREPRELLFWAISAASLVALISLDRHVAFVYLPRWFPAIPILILLFPTRPDRSYWLRAGAVVALALVPYALGPIRWNTLKSFYADCGAIRPGNDLSEVKRLMEPYRLQNVAPGDPSAPGTFAQPHLTYHPDAAHSADWCVVTTNSTRVVGVFIFPD
jgi:hypothetical protein